MTIHERGNLMGIGEAQIRYQVDHTNSSSTNDDHVIQDLKDALAEITAYNVVTGVSNGTMTVDEAMEKIEHVNEVINGPKE